MWIAACLLQSVALCDVRQTTFEFHNGFWVNLHHTLYNQASGRKAGRSPNLAAALDFYERNLIVQDLLALPMIRINMALAVAGESLQASVAPKPVIDTLEQAAPVYRAHWWPEHHRKNAQWIENVTPLVAQHEKNLKNRIRVEMSYYTTGKSAYTSLWPTLITISQLESAQRRRGRPRNDFPRSRPQSDAEAAAADKLSGKSTWTKAVSS